MRFRGIICKDKFNHFKRILILKGLLLLVILLGATQVNAFNQNPSLNWGTTTGFDAILPPPGVYSGNWFIHYHADDFKDGDGHKLPGKNEMDAVLYSPQLIWVTPWKLPGFNNLCFHAISSFAGMDVDSDLGFTSDGVMGDLIIGTFFGNKFSLGENTTLFWYLDFDVYVPIGDYDKDETINAGANFWTFEPFLSFSLQMPYGLCFTSRQHLTFNTKNNDYRLANGRTGDMRAGTLWHFNYDLMKQVKCISPNFHVGVAGYYGRQLENDEIDGSDVHNSKEKIFAIGPAVHYFHKNMVVSFRALYESEAENRTEGERYVLRIIIPF